MLRCVHSVVVPTAAIMTIDFYMMPASGPCRAALMVLKELNIPYNEKLVDLMKGDEMKPEFVAVSNGRP